MTYRAPTPTPATAALLADYADLQISFGYIGNIGGPSMKAGHDQRRFYVFTRVKSATGQASEGVPVFAVPHDHVGLWREKIEYDTPAVRAGLDRLRALVASGERRMWRDGE